MLNSLYVENGIRHHEATFNFNEGLTSVTGPNESGKSLILEFIRYALFGTKALRGSSDDYKKLLVKLSFGLRGEDYEVLRSSSKCELRRDDALICTGTKPVNARIIELFGYDMLVFDTANSINQGEIESLGKMTPAERKRMVDQTIGLTVLDDVAKWLGEQANVEAKTATSLEASLVEPTVPVAPPNYRPSDEVVKEKAGIETLVAEANRLRGWLSRPAPAVPAVPTEPCKETVEELQEQQRQHERALAQRQVLQNQLRSLASTPYTLEGLEEEEKKLEQQELYLKAQAWPKAPQWTLEQLLKFDAAWKQQSLFDQYQHAKQKVADLEAKGEHNCPSCGHKWAVEQDELEKARAALPKKAPVAAQQLPPLSPPQINIEIERVRDYKPSPYGNVLPPVTKPLTRQQIETIRQQVKDNERRVALAAEIEAIVVPPNVASVLSLRACYENAVSRYDTSLRDYEEHMVERREKESQLAAFDGIEQQLIVLNNELGLAEVYERDLVHYTKSIAAYNSALDKCKYHQERASNYKSAKTAIANLKAKIKTYLVPSLNKVASYLLSQMTNGERNQVLVDEDFNITIDGTALNKLSGSGKAVANLAIRIALGQVLTNKVFSVLMADEIDAAMDSTRAGATAECLKNLCESIGQIVLVSHKKPEADHYIELG